MDELETLRITYMEASSLAEYDEAEEGYALLLAGLRRAEFLRDAGRRRGDALVERYRRALAFFAERYGLDPAAVPDRGAELCPRRLSRAA